MTTDPRLIVLGGSILFVLGMLLGSGLQLVMGCV